MSWDSCIWSTSSAQVTNDSIWSLCNPRTSTCNIRGSVLLSGLTLLGNPTSIRGRIVEAPQQLGWGFTHLLDLGSLAVANSKTVTYILWTSSHWSVVIKLQCSSSRRRDHPLDGHVISEPMPRSPGTFSKSCLETWSLCCLLCRYLHRWWRSLKPNSAGVICQCTWVPKGNLLHHVLCAYLRQ